jgi:hypothetical protein
MCLALARPVAGKLIDYFASSGSVWAQRRAHTCGIIPQLGTAQQLLLNAQLSLGSKIKTGKHGRCSVADGQYETLALNPGEPIRDLTMRLANRGWYSGKSCIVFG